MRKPSLFAVILFFVVGTLLYGSGIFSLTHMFVLSRTGTHAQGTVIQDVERTQTDKHGNPYVLHYPRVQFQTQDNETRSFVSDGGSSTFGYQVGQTVPVIYDAANPETAHIDDFMNTWFVPLILIGMSVILMIGAVLSIKAFLTSNSL